MTTAMVRRVLGAPWPGENTIFKLFKKSEKQIALHHVHIDTRDIKKEGEYYVYCGPNDMLQVIPFSSVRPQLVEILDATEDLPESKGLYASLNPGFFTPPDPIREWLNSISGIDVLWCREPKSRFFRCIFSSRELDVLVKVLHKSAALKLFDDLYMDVFGIDYMNALWIDFAILDERWLDAVLETHQEHETLNFTGLESLTRESDYFIYGVFCQDLDNYEDYYEIIAYGAAVPAAFRQLVNSWGIPISLQRPGRS